MVSDVAVGHQGSNPHTTIGKFGNFTEVKTIQVHKCGWALDRVLHQIDQVGAATDELRPIMTGDKACGTAYIFGTFVVEVVHRAPFAVAAVDDITCFTAATIFG